MELVDLIMSSVLFFNYYAALGWWEAQLLCCAIPYYLDLNLFSGLVEIDKLEFSKG